MINSHPSVRQSTRERVLAVIDELGFRRNTTALALAGGRHRAVTVLAADTTHYGYASILRGVEEAARAATHAVGVGVLESAEEAAVAAEVQRAADVSGGLIVIAYDPAGVRALEAVPAGVPVVGVVETPVDAPSGDLPWVWTDDREAAHRVTRHLLSLGHETVHHVAIPSSTRRTGACTEGRRQALEEAGAPEPPAMQGGWGPGGGHAVGRDLAGDPSVTAILCGNDDLALGVLRAPHEAGRPVPGEVSVAGFDDAPYAACLTPSSAGPRSPCCTGCWRSRRRSTRAGTGGQGEHGAGARLNAAFRNRGCPPEAPVSGRGGCSPIRTGPPSRPPPARTRSTRTPAATAASTPRRPRPSGRRVR